MSILMIYIIEIALRTVQYSA